MGSETNALPCPHRPEVQNLDGSSQCLGLASGKPGDAEEEEEEELEEEDDDSLAGKSQDDTVSPTPEPQGAYEDEEDEEPPASLAVGFEHTRRWGPASVGHVWAASRARAWQDDLANKPPKTHHPPAGHLHLGGGGGKRVFCTQAQARPGLRKGVRAQPTSPVPHTHFPRPGGRVWEGEARSQLRRSWSRHPTVSGDWPGQ